MIEALFLLAVQPAPCAGAITQSEMNQCSAIEYARADGELNAAWRDLRETMQGTQQYDDAREAQRAWIPFRDAHCKAVTRPYAGGSIAALIRNRCLTELTETRTAQLRAMSETR